MAGQTNSWEAVLGTRDVTPYGVVEGLVFPIPASGLTVTYLGGIVRLAPTSSVTSAALNTTPGARVGREFAIAGSTKAFTASKDTYVYVNAAGAIAYYEVSNGATKPSHATLEATGGAGSQFIAKVVTDGSRVTDGGVTDLRQFAGVDMRSESFFQSFATTETGAAYWVAPGRVRVWKLQTTAVDTLAGSDAGTITAAVGVNDKYTNMTNGQTSLAARLVAAFFQLHGSSAYFIVDAGQSVRLTSAKTTSGGTAITQMLYSYI